MKQKTQAMCVLACLESIATDLGLGWTQQKIAETFRFETYMDRGEQPVGAVTVRHVPSLVLGLGLSQELRFGTGIESLKGLSTVLNKEDGFLLLAFYFGDRYEPFDADVSRPAAEEEMHAVRISEVSVGEYVRVMDPSPMAPADFVSLPWIALESRALHVVAGWTKPRF